MDVLYNLINISKLNYNFYNCVVNYFLNLQNYFEYYFYVNSMIDNSYFVIADLNCNNYFHLIFEHNNLNLSSNDL